MIKSREEILSGFRSLTGEQLNDEQLNFLENLTDTIDNYEDNTRDNIDWKKKYEQNDEEWRKKYTDRFFDDNNPPPAKEEIEIEKNDISIDDLFS